MLTLFYITAVAWIVAALWVWATYEDKPTSALRYTLMAAGLVPALFLAIAVAGEPTRRVLGREVSEGSGLAGLVVFLIGAALAVAVTIPTRGIPSLADEEEWVKAAHEAYPPKSRQAILWIGSVAAVLLAVVTGIGIANVTDSVHLGILPAIGVLVAVGAGTMQLLRFRAVRAFAGTPGSAAVGAPEPGSAGGGSLPPTAVEDLIGSASEAAMRDVDRMMYGSTPEELAASISAPACPACSARGAVVQTEPYSGDDLDVAVTKAWKCPECGHQVVSVD
ncbi:MAG: hypothetical protein KJN63_05195 [Acidimicrobiia bacterium]|nr:hypothetical protein [Acidimicrobiia bacterium]